LIKRGTTFECHLKIGRCGADPSVVFSTETRELKRWRGNSWIEYAIDQGDINTSLATDSEESMDKITVESMRGNTLVKVNTYLCFQTR
jgi:hypothetical protein